MKNTFRDIGTHDMLTGLRTKKKVTRLLMLTAVLAAIFATPTVSFASSHLSNGSDQSHTARATTIHSNPQSMIAIRMLDSINGWALTRSSILKTSDDGIHWSEVTPKGQTPGINAQGEFLTTQIAWVVWQSTQGASGQTQTITVLHTTNGGTSWQTTTINNATGFLVAPPRFLNTQQGWLVTTQRGGMMQGLTTTYRTIDSGQTWTTISQQVTPVPSDLSFSNAQLGWLGIEWPGDRPVIEKTVNGGQRWQQQALPVPAHIAEIDNVQTTAAILIGTNGLLPAHISTGTDPQARLDIYTTQDTGATWTVGTLANFDSTDVYALDAQHVWAEEINRNALHFSSDGGKTWVQLAQTPHHFGALSFADTHNGRAIDDAGQLYQTRDGGTNWQSINSSIS